MDEKTSIDRTAAPSPEDEKPDEHHVDVESGKAEFEALRRTLSRASSLHRVATGQKSLEDADDGDDFDLKEYMVRVCGFVALLGSDRLIRIRKTFFWDRSGNRMFDACFVRI